MEEAEPIKTYIWSWITDENESCVIVVQATSLVMARSVYVGQAHFGRGYHPVHQREYERVRDFDPDMVLGLNGVWAEIDTRESGFPKLTF